jgi:hypothetical protein
MIEITNTITNNDLRLDIGQIQMEDYKKIQDYVQLVAMCYFHEVPQNRVRGSIDWFSHEKIGSRLVIKALAEDRTSLGKVNRSKPFAVSIRYV